MNFAEPLKTIADNVPKVYQAGYDDGVAAGGGGASSSEIVENLPIALDFSDGDQEIVAPDGVLVKSAIIQKPETLNPENIAEGVNIAGIVGTLAAGGGTSDELCYVTFMSYDGSVEYGKKAVAVGDDCADPIARGIFETPTRESDAQYNYTFYGWATEVNGAADSNWNKSITEDKTVYANFASAVRYYTITYYDSDGITVLKTEQVAYGSVPAYTPTKDGYSFNGWSPAIVAVTGDTSYTAVWAEKVTFAGGSWADIARICEAGKAAEYFNIGDSRTIPITIDDVSYSYTAKIVGFNHDTKSDGTKAGISVMFFTTPEEQMTWGTTINRNESYKNSNFYEKASAFLNYIPTDLESVIKAVQKDYNTVGSSTVKTHEEKLWIPSAQEICSDGNQYSVEFGELYEMFSKYPFGYTYLDGHKAVDTAGAVVKYCWVRDCSPTSGDNSASIYFMAGDCYTVNNNNISSKLANLVMGFCI